MSAVIDAPVEMVEAVAALHFPPRVDRRVQALMDLNNEGQLTAKEKDELEAWVELSETLALVRAKAKFLLERRGT
jgi:hypothetical protein